MHLLLVTDSFAPEGRGLLAAAIRATGRALARRGHEVHVFTRVRRPLRPEYEVGSGRDGPLRVTSVNVTFRHARNVEWLTADPEVHAAFEQCLAGVKPDLVHVHHLRGLSTTLVAAVKARGLPLVMSLHDAWTVCPRGERITVDLKLCETLDRERCHACVTKLWPGLLAERAQERTLKDPVLGTLAPASFAEFDRHALYVLGLADLLVCPSESQRDRMLEFPLDPARTVVLPSGIDVRSSPRPRTGTRSTRFGFVGRVTPSAGIEVLLDAFQRLAGRGYSLEIVGEIEVPADDPEFATRFERVLGAGSGISYRDLAPGDDPYELFERIEALVVPSIAYEAEALAARAALTVGLPVIGSDLAALREALDGERDAVLVPPRDAGLLATAINDFAYAPPPAGSRRRGGSGSSSLERHVEALESLYARASALAADRRPHLVVAPPSFPSPTRPGRRSDLEIPWQEIAVRTSQRGRIGASVVTRPPTDEAPTLGLVVELTDGDRAFGTVEIDVDLSAVAAAVATATASLVPPPLTVAQADEAAPEPVATVVPPPTPAPSPTPKCGAAPGSPNVAAPAASSTPVLVAATPSESSRRVRTIPGRDAGRLLRGFGRQKRDDRERPSP